MIPKISSIYPVDIQKQDHQSSKDGAKKKQVIQFKDILEKTMNGTTAKK
jgi:hypothetical protein